MNKREALVFTAYTGQMFVKDFSEFHAFAEELLGRPIWTHQFANKDIAKLLKKSVEKEFIQICEHVKEDSK